MNFPFVLLNRSRWPRQADVTADATEIIEYFTNNHVFFRIDIDSYIAKAYLHIYI